MYEIRINLMNSQICEIFTRNPSEKTLRFVLGIVLGMEYGMSPKLSKPK